MRTTELTIRNPSGLHARPAAMFVKAAAGFGSRITLENLDRGSAPADAKSIIAIMSSGVSAGHRVRLTADGADEDAAIDALEQLIASGIGEAIPE
ncbi:MAG TPA: HPr family phosphocarrier protein [Candidatus Limnocylindrales bacterium]|nr:HPr family phosphocarrier protein [Candidatus Limnocylindrales bacterium]